MKDSIKEIKKIIDECESESDWGAMQAMALLAIAKINYETHLLLKEQTTKNKKETE